MNARIEHPSPAIGAADPLDVLIASEAQMNALYNGDKSITPEAALATARVLAGLNVDRRR
ncbi:MAG: hypothetical protein LW865_02180 [Betaproteobacteria bacterium]|jgi:hypothetical protein|nr:hypothetical protein [Betaproteobacteria bacterium]